MVLLAGFDVPLWALLLVVAAVLLYVYGTWTFNTWSKQGIKGDTPLPFFGNLLKQIFSGGFYHTDIDLAKRRGRIIGEYSGRTPSLAVSDPEFLRKAMVKEFANMPNRRSRDSGVPILNMFMTALTDDHWRHVRSSLTPTFTTGKLKQMKALIDSCATRLTEKLMERDGTPFDTKQVSGGFTMDVIASTAFGIQVDSQANPDNPILINAAEIMGTRRRQGFKDKLKFIARAVIFLMLPAPLTKLLGKLTGGSFINMDALNYFSDLSKKILEEREGQDVPHKDFVQLCKEKLIDDPKPGDADTQVDEFGAAWSYKGLTRDEIVANAVLFFLAGFETTANTLNFAMYELALNPDVQQKVYEEIKTHVRSENPSYDELAHMDYLDWVIQETLRLYPPASRVDRLVAAETSIDGITLPAGSLVAAMIYAIHHDEEFWPEPTKFDPERFSPENREDRHSCAWIPFGIGNRNCIGMRLALLEIKVALVRILSKMRLETCPTTLVKPLKLKHNFQMGTVDPIEIKAEIRT